MPRRAHGRPLLNSGSSRSQNAKSQQRRHRHAALDALETAERQNPESIQIRQHRLGEVADDSDGPETRADADERSSKRRKVTDAREEGDDVDEGSDLEGGTWHTGVNEEDEDSDLDSDEAFGESDEERFADFTFRGSESRLSEKKPKIKRAKQVNLNEELEGEEDEVEEESDDLGDEAVDLATAWDMDGVEIPNAKRVKQSRKPWQENNSESEDSSILSGSENSGTPEADEQSQFSVSDDEMQGDLDGLRTFVEGLSRSKADENQRQKFNSKDLPDQPSRFGLTSAKLSAADLLQYVKDPAQRQSLKILQSAERSGPQEYKKGIPGKLSVPLVKRQQDRLDRAAAYDRSKETLNRWIDTVKQNRRAEHLSFPLVDHAKESMLGQKQLLPTNQSAPATELEAKILQIMEESGVGPKKGQSAEDQEQAFEELEEKKMDVDDVKARRAQLRMARELMFREEIRAKRIKKIKSKAFRRVHRKERGKIEAQQREALEAAGLLNSDEEREKQERRRAEERMGARHRESKWAKGVKQAGRATWDDDTRAGVSDLARRDEELRRRIMGKDVTDPGASGDESESDSDYSADTEADDQKLTEALSALESTNGNVSGSKLGSMAFMQRAEAARKAVNDKEISAIRLALDDKDAVVAANEEDYQEPTGRQKFGVLAQTKAVQPKKKPANEFEAPLSDGEDRDDGVSMEPESMSLNSAAKPTTTLLSTKVIANGQKGRSLTTHVNQPLKENTIKKASHHVKRITETAIDDYTSPSESESDTPSGLQGDEAKAALAASIFAGPDDIVQEFSKEKAELAEEENDQVVDNTLPGWGSWTGAGISKREQKRGKGRFLTTVKGVAPEKRRDAKLDRVIINEKRTKKNGKYLATELPFPFENRQQYERSLRLPIGPEWSTVNHYQESIKPRVLLKQGTVIRPIAKPIT